MKMRWIGVAFLAAMSFMALEAEQITVTATNHNKCMPAGATFTVPANRTATNFKLIGITKGSNCHTGETLRGRAGFTISDQNYNIIYRYDPGTLSNLRLSSGRYHISVGGGVGAGATLTFELQ